MSKKPLGEMDVAELRDALVRVANESSLRARKIRYMAEHQRVREVAVEQVIRTVIVRGDGVHVPIRQVEQYWLMDGTLIAERDPMPGPEGDVVAALDRGGEREP